MPTQGENRQQPQFQAATVEATEDAMYKRAVEAALEDPKIAEPGFETSKVMALICVLLTERTASGEGVISSRKRLVRTMKTCYQFVIKGADGKEVLWFADMKKKGKLGKGKAPVKPDVTIWASDRDFVDLAVGKANPAKLFEAKRIKVRGNIDRAMNVERILTQERRKVYEVGSAKGKTAGAEGAKQAAQSAGRWAGGAKAKL